MRKLILMNQKMIKKKEIAITSEFEFVDLQHLSLKMMIMIVSDPICSDLNAIQGQYVKAILNLISKLTEIGTQIMKMIKTANQTYFWIFEQIYELFIGMMIALFVVLSRSAIMILKEDDNDNDKEEVVPDIDIGFPPIESWLLFSLSF
ncbi:MAG: hypothetical protein EZS28_020689 [Streblomastix strix]|uniref:Uncharacterized protein n=1 Tax=Streblomastix strix TaxID=222440 RepID=A0A5J4VMT8_9EUKA|nr:MAG: hypothetical protein EZS28_020689 [Streblomastix strix]